MDLMSETEIFKGVILRTEARNTHIKNPAYRVTLNKGGRTITWLFGHHEKKYAECYMQRYKGEDIKMYSREWVEVK